MRKPPFRIKPLVHPVYKFVVRGKVNGKWQRSYFTNKAEAATFAQLKNTEMLNKGQEAVDFPSWLRVMAADCNTQLQAHGKTIRDATEHFLKFLRASAKSCTAAELVKELLASKQADGASRRYLKDLKSRLTRFANDFNGQVVSMITGGQIDDWLRSLPVSATTRNNFRRVTVVMFNFAVQRGYATSNPAKSAAKAKVVDASPGILSVAETARLLESATVDVLPYLAIGSFAGLRPAELTRLEWENVDFDAGLIEVTAEKSKTARRRFVKMQPNLGEWLAPYRAHKGPVCSPNARTLIEAARRGAGVEEWPANALRHGFASYHLAQFKDAAALALEMGHTDSGMIFEHYRQLVKPKDAACYWQIMPSAEAGEKVVAFSQKA